MVLGLTLLLCATTLTEGFVAPRSRAAFANTVVDKQVKKLKTRRLVGESPDGGGQEAGFSITESAAVVTPFEEVAAFSLSSETLESWGKFSAAVAVVLGLVYFLWIRGDTGYADDYAYGVDALAGNDPHLAMVIMGTIFATTHSGLAALRPSLEKVVGARAWRVVFALASLPLSYSWIVYFIIHRWEGFVLWDLHAVPGLHAAVWVVSLISFLFLYPSTFNLKEVAAIEKPKLHLWGTGVIRVTRHPQAVGQALWSAAHLAWVGTSVSAMTMALLVGHHAFATWHGDRRLKAEHGELFEELEATTSVIPLAAIIDGRQQLPSDYWKEWARAPYAFIVVGSVGAYLAHPYMQAGAALFENAGLEAGGLLG